MKFAYILLVIAALVCSSRMVLELAGHWLTTSGDDVSAADVRPVAVDEVNSSVRHHQLDPELQQRIRDILYPEKPETQQTADASEVEQVEVEQVEVEQVEVEQVEVAAVEITVPVVNKRDMAPAADLDVLPPTIPVRRSGSPVRQQTPLHPQMLTPGNFVYLGGFRPPFGENMPSRFGHGGLDIAYRPDGDPHAQRMGTPGSLFMVGHPHDQLVAEISIPAPLVSPDRVIDDLPVAEVLQSFSDITFGIRDQLTNGSSEPFEIGGLQVVGNRLHWTLYKYYNVTGVDYLSHGLSSVNLSERFVRGLWHLGPWRSGDSRWHSYKHAGYICDVPQSIADRYLGGRNLMSGLQISTGRQTSSQGPALFAYRINNERPPRGGSSLDALPLLWYPMSAPMRQHHPADSWQGAAWLTSGDKQAVVVVGRKALGPVHYGLPRPGECYDYKGYHGSSYEAQMLFYAPGQLLTNAGKGACNTEPWYRWDARTPGGGLDRFMYQDCRKEIGGMAFDRQRGLLYIAEVDAAISLVNEWEALPVVHVLQLVP